MANLRIKAGRRADRRDSYDEKEQKQIIKDCCKEIACEFNINLNLSKFESVSKGQGKDGKYFSSEGKITPVSVKRNHCKDSKAMDGVVFFVNKETNDSVDIYFFCKYTKEKGGSQDYIPFEVEVTKKCIENNNDDNVVSVFMLEGEYWSPSIIEDCDFCDGKTVYATRSSMKETLSDILKSHKII